MPVQDGKILRIGACKEIWENACNSSTRQMGARSKKEKQISAEKKGDTMNLLSIGGSDPSSGAGIQSDIRVFSNFNVHGLTVITAITGQNTSSFGMVEPVSKRILENQLDSVLEDFSIDGIKIGMVYNSEIIKTISRRLKKLRVPIIVDPVIRSTTGGRLIRDSALDDLRRCIIPLATVITPNKFEAEILAKTETSSHNTVGETARIIQGMGAKNIVITGISRGGVVTDHVLEEDAEYTISGDKIAGTNHGSGCNYSAAITYAVSNKKTVRESLKFAKGFTSNSIRNAKRIGRGIRITDIRNRDGIGAELSHAIDRFVEIKDIYKNIPECQTNFVYAGERPRSTKDVLGISGRIVKTGKRAAVAGRLEYGGSKHVATALLAVNVKFPEIRSAVNLKYEKTLISKIRKSKMRVSSYDRMQEPGKIKSGGSTIQWGIKDAVKDLKIPPDAVFHTGDFGKEPMIILFGDTPRDILKKLDKIKRRSG